MAFNCPVSHWKADQLIDQLALTQGQMVLDAGCGNGEFLLRLLTRTGAAGLGVDSNEAVIARAVTCARATLPDGSYRFLALPMADAEVEPPGIYHDHAGNIAVAERLGLVPLYATVSNKDEWDDFEWGHRQRFELAAWRNPDDPAAQQQLQASRKWRDGYLRWGRDTMGFGLYVFLRP